MTSLNELIELLQLMVFLFRATIRIITSVHMRVEEKLSAAPAPTFILIVLGFVWNKILQQEQDNCLTHVRPKRNML